MTFASVQNSFACAIFCIGLLLAASPAIGQLRDIRAQRLVLDDDAGDGDMNFLTLQVPSLGADLTLTFPSSLPGVSGSLLSATTTGSLDWTNSPSLNSLTLTNGLTVSGGVVDLSGAASVDFAVGSIGFEDIGSGTSTGSALVIGGGSTLSASGGGVIGANEFVGTGSTSGSVDLGTGEVAGVLGIANGGTGSSSVSGARTNLGLGTLSTQDADAVAISGGVIEGVTLSGSISGSPVLSGTPELTNGLTVSGGVVDLSGAASVDFAVGSIGFEDIGSGTSTGSALVIGGGSTLSASGGGVIGANEFVGTGSTSGSVDLGTGEVAGVLGIANGGTGSSSASGARTNLGLGTLSTQDADAVAISGGVIEGVTLSGSISGSPVLSGTPELTNGLTVSGGVVDLSGAASVDFAVGSIGFEDIGSGTSTGSALVIGGGSTLSASGGGVIGANEFVGMGSTSGSVDLGTGEVAGVLGIANGGTGSSSVSGARTNLGLGTLSTQDADAVAISGGVIEGVTLSGSISGSPVLSGTPELTNGLTVSGGVVDLSGAASVDFAVGSIGFEDIGSGTSTGSALVIGGGSTLSASGGGVIGANEFVGTGSTSGSVDLGTGEVAGVLGIANGGTNSGAVPTAGGVAYGDGTSYQFTGAGVAGQFLISDGANPPVWSTTVPSLTAPLTVEGSPVAGAMFTVNENGVNSPALFDLQVGGSSVVIVENEGDVGFGTPLPEHTVHAVNDRVTDERAAVYGVATATTTDQAVGVWGDADNTGAGNTGSVGMLATGNGNSTAGTTNIALQVNDGQFAVGRTTETGTGYTVINGATGGVAYSAEGPSGVIQIAIPAVIVALPAVGQSLFNTTITVNNRYASSGSIVLVTVQDAPAGVLSLLGARLITTATVSNRVSGSFDLTFSISNLSLLPLNIGSGNVSIGYMVVNPSQ